MAIGNRDYNLKGHMNISHAPKPSEKAVIRKKPGSDLYAYLGEPCREAGGNWNSV